jgi:subtilase family serine protease
VQEAIVMDQIGISFRCRHRRHHRLGLTWRRAIVVLAGCALVLAGAACGVPISAGAGQGTGFPATAAGAQAGWLLTAARSLPIPAADIEAHFDSAFLAQARPAAIDADVGGIAPIRLVSVTATVPTEIVFMVQAGGLAAPSPELQVWLGVDGKGLIDTLGLSTAPAVGSGVPLSLIGGGCLAPASAKDPVCYSPQAIRAAYGLGPLTARGLDGKGRTIAIIVSSVQSGDPDATNLQLALADYDSYFHLPPPDLRVISSFDPGASPSVAGKEEIGDVEVAHAIAPGAAIRVVLVPGQDGVYEAGAIATSWLPAWRYAIANADVVSFSGGAGDTCFTSGEIAALHSVLAAADARHVTVVAASGDTGPVNGCTDQRVSSSIARQVLYPASDPLVLAVGGTSLFADPATGAYQSETAWGGLSTSSEMASGGGTSQLFTRPAYQDGVAGIGNQRAVPDVSADADATRGIAVMAVTAGGLEIVSPGGGTSLSTPMWAGLIAIADQSAGRDLGFVNPALYAIARSAQYRRAFHDVAQGNTTVVMPAGPVTGYAAGPGWDMATGWGSPDASVLVPLLAAYDKS